METTAPPAAPATRWIGLAVLSIPCLIYAADLTILNLAVPQLSAELRPSASELLWIVDIYGFMVAGFLITMGTLGDRIGRRRLLMFGAAAFGVTSLVAAYANSAETLILARAMQGIAGATLAPSTLSLIRSTFLDDRERQFAIGVWVASFSTGAALGPVFGGLILEHFHWSAVFLVNVPLMALVLILAPILLPEHRDPETRPLDLTSAVLSLITVLPVIAGIKHLAEGGSPSLAVASIAAGVLAGVIFVRRQQRLANPMIDLGLFRLPKFAAALSINVAGLFTVMATFVLIAQHLQSVLGLSPLAAGLWTAPSGVVFALGSVVTPFLVARFGSRAVLSAGFAVAALGYGWLAMVPAEAGLASLVGGMLVLCVGLSPVGPITTDIVLSGAPAERAGAASAISETSFEFGAAVGIAVMGSLFVAVYRAWLDPSTLTGFEQHVIETAQSGLGGAIQASRGLPAADAERLTALARSAFAIAFNFTSLVSAVVSLATAALAWRLLDDNVS